MSFGAPSPLGKARMLHSGTTRLVRVRVGALRGMPRLDLGCATAVQSATLAVVTIRRHALADREGFENGQQE